MDIRCISEKGVIKNIPEHITKDVYMMRKMGLKIMETPKVIMPHLESCGKLADENIAVEFIGSEFEEQETVIQRMDNTIDYRENLPEYVAESSPAKRGRPSKK